MYTLTRQYVTIKTLHSFIRYYSFVKKTHYEILRLRKNCTDKEIKEAFIKLSKEYHPDKNKNADAQQHFIRIVEAYNVLGKRISRAHYDHLSGVTRHGSSQRGHEQARPSRPTPHYYEYYAMHSRRRQTQQTKQTYPETGVKRVPNHVLILLCFGIAFIGTMLQVFVIREMYVVQKKQAIERTEYLAEELEKVRQSKEGKTNEMQTRLLLEKIVGSSNTTIATASLGQALATADKENYEESLLPDLNLGITEMSNFWYRPQENNEVTLNDVFRKLRMYAYYYYYGR